jgi:hypothetical protein
VLQFFIVLQVLDNLERPLLKLAPLGGRRFAALAVGEAVELFTADRAADDIIASALLLQPALCECSKL